MEQLKIKPALIEKSTKYFVNKSLKDIRTIKNKYITIIVNISLFILFIAVIGGLLYYKYKGKMTPYQKQKNDQEKKIYLYKKLQQYSYNKQKESQSIITNLPVMHPEINLK